MSRQSIQYPLRYFGLDQHDGLTNRLDVTVHIDTPLVRLKNIKLLKTNFHRWRQFS